MSATEQLKFLAFERELIDPLRGHELTEVEGYVSSLLLGASSARPIGIAEIRHHVELALNQRLDERTVKKIIRTLRKDHAFPILSRRRKPSGYWWCSSVEEMKSFIATFRGQALDELTTVAAIVKSNYPELAGQLRFDLDF